MTQYFVTVAAWSRPSNLLQKAALEMAAGKCNRLITETDEFARDIARAVTKLNSAYPKCRALITGGYIDNSTVPYCDLDIRMRGSIRLIIHDTAVVVTFAIHQVEEDSK